MASAGASAVGEKRAGFSVPQLRPSHGADSSKADPEERRRNLDKHTGDFLCRYFLETHDKSLSENEKRRLELVGQEADMETLWAQGRKEEAWQYFKKVYRKTYPKKADDIRHFNAFAEAADYIIELRSHTEQECWMLGVGLTFAADWCDDDC